MSRTRALTVSSVALLTSLLLTGCAPTLAGVDSPSLQPGAVKTMSDSEAFTTFSTIAETSCDKANLEGVTEVTSVGNKTVSTSVLVPKDQGVEDFSAAFQENTAKGVTNQIVYETTGLFYSCTVAQTLEMAAEGNIKPEDAGVTVRYNRDAGDLGTIFTVTQVYDGEEPDITTYTVKNGLIDSASFTTAKNEQPVTTVHYGATKESLAILTAAVEANKN
jgi:hypothetical protein